MKVYLLYQFSTELAGVFASREAAERALDKTILEAGYDMNRKYWHIEETEVEE